MKKIDLATYAISTAALTTEITEPIQLKNLLIEIQIGVWQKVC
jgi:hypothetical protein